MKVEMPLYFKNLLASAGIYQHFLTDVNSPLYVPESRRTTINALQDAYMLMQGEKILKENKDIYLPQKAVESYEAWERRVADTHLVNAYLYAINSNTEKMSASSIVLSEDAMKNEIFTEMYNEADLYKNSINCFFADVYRTGLAYGSCGIVVEAPFFQGEISIEDRKKYAIRPHFRKISPLDIIGFKEENGEITEIRTVGIRQQNEGKFGTISVLSVKIYNKNYFSEIVFDREKETLLYEIDNQLGIIPFVFFIPSNQTSRIDGDLPFKGLDSLTLAHFRSTSHQNSVLSVARQPILVASGFSPRDTKEQLIIDRSKFIALGDPAAKLQYVEPTGKSIESGFQHISEIEKNMGYFGVDVSRTNGKETATEKILEDSENKKNNESWSKALIKTIQSVMEMSSLYIGDEFPDNAVYFSTGQDAKNISADENKILEIAISANAISRKTVFEICKGVFPQIEESSWEDELELILEDERQGRIEMSNAENIFNEMVNNNNNQEGKEENGQGNEND